MNWTQIILAIITTAGTVITAVFANRARGSAVAASSHAEAAKEASLRPPADRPTPVDGSSKVA